MLKHARHNSGCTFKSLSDLHGSASRRLWVRLELVVLLHNIVQVLGTSARQRKLVPRRILEKSLLQWRVDLKSYFENRSSAPKDLSFVRIYIYQTILSHEALIPKVQFHLGRVLNRCKERCLGVLANSAM